MPTIDNLSRSIWTCPDLSSPVLICPVLKWTELNVCLWVCLPVKFHFIELLTLLKRLIRRSQTKRIMLGQIFMNKEMHGQNIKTVVTKWMEKLRSLCITDWTKFCVYNISAHDTCLNSHNGEWHNRSSVILSPVVGQITQLGPL